MSVIRSFQEIKDVVVTRGSAIERPVDAFVPPEVIRVDIVIKLVCPTGYNTRYIALGVDFEGFRMVRTIYMFRSPYSSDDSALQASRITALVGILQSFLSLYTPKTCLGMRAECYQFPCTGTETTATRHLSNRFSSRVKWVGVVRTATNERDD